MGHAVGVEEGFLQCVGGVFVGMRGAAGNGPQVALMTGDQNRKRIPVPLHMRCKQFPIGPHVTAGPPPFGHGSETNGPQCRVRDQIQVHLFG